MASAITTDIVIAYSQCHRKAFLLLVCSDTGKQHQYILILKQHRKLNQERYVDHHKHISMHVQTYSYKQLRNGSEFLINADLKGDGFEAECDLLTKIAGRSRFGKFSYEPSIFASTYNITKEKKLELTYVAFVLKILQRTSPSTGRIIGITAVRP